MYISYERNPANLAQAFTRSLTYVCPPSNTLQNISSVYMLDMLKSGSCLVDNVMSN